MIYIKSIEIVENYYQTNNIKLGFKFDCSDINVFVGEQGCGKSTMLKMLRSNHSDLKIELTQWTIENGVETYFFDTENDNPRIKDPNLFTSASGKDKGIG